MITISNGVESFSPILLNGYEATSETRNIAHRIIGRPAPDYSLGGDSTRTDSLALLFADETEAHAAAEVLKDPGVFTLTDDDTPEIDMTFIREGNIRVRVAETRREWLVECGFQEVDA